MSKPILSDQDFGSTARILNLPDPTASQHPATKNYVDARFELLAWKDSVRAASTANINLAAPGANIDGVAMAADDRFLAKDQTTPTENGLYVWNGAAAAATRAADASAFDELESAIVTAEEGTTNAGTSWRQTAINGVLGTNALTFVSFGASSGGGSGWTQIGTTQTPTGVASSSITGIPTTYSDLVIEILGLSPSATATLNIELSDDGVNWTGTGIVANAVAAADSVYGQILIPRYRGDTGQIAITVATTLTANRTLSTSGTSIGRTWRIATGIQAIRLSQSAGNFDAGSWKLWGR